MALSAGEAVKHRDRDYAIRRPLLAAGVVLLLVALFRGRGQKSRPGGEPEPEPERWRHGPDVIVTGDEPRYKLAGIEGIEGIEGVEGIEGIIGYYLDGNYNFANLRPDPSSASLTSEIVGAIRDALAGAGIGGNEIWRGEVVDTWGDEQ